MELDRFKTAWQKQPLEGAAARPLEDTMEDVRRRAARFNRQIRQRDLLESGAGLLVIGMFGYFAWLVPYTAARIGAGVVIAGCVVTMIRLYLARNRNGTSADMPALEFCAAELKRLDDQIRLLSTVGRWYLAPLLGGAALFVAGAGGPATSRVIVLLVLLATAVVIYRLNHAAVRNHLRPMRDELAGMLRQLTKNS
ncbi:MAG TPA: hypothetical protein VHJ77_00245 [Vicinamibacterales bacterium]|nr:hypothetical protein [Vicinamibacterales bacterium]